mmetsp:Transcript_861/g.2808  ORF Transcript_861/g.2808 Transcript_861/m.2808 type:complete len:239 (-) Transcript_861:576-1292(-)
MGRQAGRAGRVRRRRLERDGSVPRVHRRRGREDHRRRGRGRGHGTGAEARGDAHARFARRLARLVFVPDPGRGGADHRAAQHLRRSGLPRHRPGALVPQRFRTRGVPRGDGPGGARRVRQSVAMRGDHPRARDVSRLRLPREAHADAEEGAEGHPELQRARRQGREHRGGGAQHLGRGGHLNAREKHDFLTSVVVSRIYKVKPLYSNRARDEPTTRAAGCYIRWTRAQTRPPLPCVRC